MAPGDDFENEWRVYLRELPRWLAEGKEGLFVLIKGEEVIGLFDSSDAALDVGRQRFGSVPVFVREIREWETAYRQRCFSPGGPAFIYVLPKPRYPPVSAVPSVAKGGSPMTTPLHRAIHYTQLKPLPPGDLFEKEWGLYLRELPRWLAEGKEGRFVLIKGEEVIGFWDTKWAASDAGLQRFGLVPLFVSEIREWEPVYRQRFA
jgi:hypothetical protein